MNKDGNNISHIHFLKDEIFIKWKLFSTDELNNYWEDYLITHPENMDEFLLAVKLFDYLKFSTYKIPKEKKEETFLYLMRENSKQIKVSKVKTIYVNITVAVLGILLISTFFYNYYTGYNKNIVMDDYFVGNVLESEDIQFVTRNKTKTYNKNIEISLTDEGKVNIKTGKDNILDDDLLVDNLLVDEKSLNKLVVPYGKRTTLTLSDGSKIWLNSGTVIEFPSKFKNESRDIFLTSGEIFVQAAKDKQKPFYIHANDFDVKVYGTSFNISAYRDSFPSVVLMEGSISLNSPKINREIFIYPNEQITLFDNGMFGSKVVEVEKYVSWKDGFLIIDNIPLSNLLVYIERYYNLSIDFKHSRQMGNILCEGKLVLSDNIDNVMNTIAIITKTNYKRENNKLYIFNNN